MRIFVSRDGMQVAFKQHTAFHGIYKLHSPVIVSNLSQPGGKMCGMGVDCAIVFAADIASIPELTVHPSSLDSSLCGMR